MNSISRIEASAATVPVKARFSTAEFLHMIEKDAFAGIKLELVDGELERMTPPMNAHSGRQTLVVARLLAVLPFELMRIEIGVVVSEDTVLAADVAILREPVPVSENRMLTAEDFALVIEVAETTITRDMNMKRAKYASANIPLYWVIDGTRSVVHIFAEPVAGDYASISTVRFGAPLALPGSERTITID